MPSTTTNLMAPGDFFTTSQFVPGMRNATARESHRSKVVFDLKLPQVGFKLVCHRECIDAGDVAVILELNDLA